ncbi:MAG: NADH-quinone oxidoreductase subunit N [Lutibacter sp.]|nr:NADH-quinone oxidoreductase subunit N [Lutibacter sp.]
MRQELLLLAITLALLVGTIFVSKNKQQGLITLALILFGIHTLIGFLPLEKGHLFGGMFYTDPLIHFVKNLLNVGVFTLLLLSADWLRKKVLPLNNSGEFFVLLFCSLLGLYYLLSAGDFLQFYLGLELSTLPVVALAAYETSKRISSEAGIKLILSAALSSGVMLFGISLLYATTGSIYFDSLAETITSNHLSITGMVLFFSGLAFKISLVPFHFWTADVYEGAPISVAAYLSVISKGTAAFVLMILLFTVFRPLAAVWEPLVYGLAIATMCIGNLFALRQQNMKRFLAFSSVAQAGFILLGLLNNSLLGSATVLYFIVIYLFSNLAAFGVVQVISLQTGKENMSDYNGLYRSNPKLSLVMMLGLFSLAGIPPVAGFFGKFFLFTAAADKGYYLLVFIAVVNVTISLYYYLLVIRAMFLRKSAHPIPHITSAPSTRWGLLITVIGILTLGIYSPVYRYIYELSSWLFN